MRPTSCKGLLQSGVDIVKARIPQIVLRRAESDISGLWWSECCRVQPVIRAGCGASLRVADQVDAGTLGVRAGKVCVACAGDAKAHGKGRAGLVGEKA